MHVQVVQGPPTKTRNTYYPSNRDPLHPSPLCKLPLGAVRARGWLSTQLDLMVDGMVGRLAELSTFLRPDNGWFKDGNPGWEEQPYWLRGAYPLAVLTGNRTLMETVQSWIEATLNSQTSEGYFGSSYHRKREGRGGRVLCDLWPHMVMLDALIQHYEYSGDDRVPQFAARFFQFCSRLPDEEFIPHVPGPRWQAYREDFGDWKIGVQIKRAGDMLPHLYWLYNQTADPQLLSLATRFYRSILPPVSEWLDDHIVNFTQRFAYPAIYGQQEHMAANLARTEYWYGQHLGTWGQQPRGIFGADERIRPGKTDPRRGFETCGMVEFAKNFYLLGRLTGDPVYADRCEDVMLNHFPAAQTPALKALHYLTASNQPQLDASENHDYFNKGPQISYSPHIYRCCQHNVAMGWPWYVQNLWQATADNGLAVWMYAPCTVTAKVGNAGQEVSVLCDTEYPFRDRVRIAFSCEESVRFPLYLRVPRWSGELTVGLNGRPLAEAAPPGTYLRVERQWADGDVLNIHLPMEVSLTRWPRTGSVTVDRGPLSYSVKIDEQWRRHGGTDDWPEWEVLPRSPWNYGLVLDEDTPEAAFEVVESDPAVAQLWTPRAAPVEIVARARRLSEWTMTDETVDPLPESPVVSSEPEETIRMIPLGCARLRMSCLPVLDADE